MVTQVISSQDILHTAQLAHLIWNQHYVPIIGQAQVDYMVSKFQSEKAIADQIENGYQYFLVHHQEKPCGYLALLPNALERKLMISKLYVDVNHRGLNLGSELLNHAIQEAQEKGFKTLWLTVNKHNTSSIRWYQKRGFEIKEKIVMDIGNGFVMDDYLMILEVK